MFVKTVFGKKELCMKNVNVVLTGKLLAEADASVTVERMMHITGLDEKKVWSMLTSGKPIVVKKNIDPELGNKYCLALKKLGVASELRSVFRTPTIQAQKRAPLVLTAGSNEVSTQQVASPGNTGSAPVREITQSSLWSALPAQVEASHGWIWIRDAVVMFHQALWSWSRIIMLVAVIGITFALFGLAQAMYALVCSQVLSILLAPVLVGGLHIAAHTQFQGEKLRVGLVFSGFSHNRNQLILLGVIQVLFSVSFGILLVLALGGGLTEAGLEIIALPFTSYHAISLLIVVAVSLVFCAAYWFAPALIALTSCSVWYGLQKSLLAVLKNWAAFLVYSLYGLLAIMGLGILFSMIPSITASILYATHSPNVLFIMPFLLFIVFGIPLSAILLLSMYTAFKDIFYQETVQV